jgi:type II secretory pathway component PulK
MRTRTAVSIQRPARALRWPARRGLVLPVVLVLIGLLALAMAGFMFFVRAEATGIAAQREMEQARLAAESGLEELGMLLRDKADDPTAWWNVPETFRHRLVFANTFTREDDEVQKMGSRTQLLKSDRRPEAWRYSVVAPNFEGPPGTIRYGITPESGKLNLNAATDNEIERLFTPLLLDLGVENAPELIAALEDWMDEDDDARPGGAESAYYSNLVPGYNAKNGRLDTLDELLLIKGFTPAILWGEDVNRNGVLDHNEDDGDQSFPYYDNADGVLNHGLAGYCTVWSRETRRVSSGGPQGPGTGGLPGTGGTPQTPGGPGSDVPGGDGGDTGDGGKSGGLKSRAARSQSREPGKAQSGQQPPSGLPAGGPQPTPEELEGLRRLQELAAQAGGGGNPPAGGAPGSGGSNRPGGAGGRPPGRGPGNGGRPPTPGAPGTPGSPTTPGRPGGPGGTPGGGGPTTQPGTPGGPGTGGETPGQTKLVEGLVNVNTAPLRVLQALEGMPPETAEAIVTQRAQLSGEALAKADWVMTSGAMDAYTYNMLKDKLTTKSLQFHVEIIGYGDHTKLARRYEWVIEMRGKMMQVLYHQDLTSLGLAWPIDNDDALLLNR